MRGHAPPGRLLGRSAFQLRLPSIHRTADKIISLLKNSMEARSWLHRAPLEAPKPDLELRNKRL